MRGNVVEYLQAEVGEEPPKACVYGVIYAEPTPEDPQLRKILVLYDVPGRTFFLGTWPVWRRLPKPDLEGEFICDDNEHVQFYEREDVARMVTLFNAHHLKVFETISTRRQAVAKAAEAPPR